MPLSKLKESQLKRFDEKFFTNIPNKLGWKLPRIAFYWEESGRDNVEWEDMEDELKSFLSQCQTEWEEELVQEVHKIENKYANWTASGAYNRGGRDASREIISIIKE